MTQTGAEGWGDVGKNSLLHLGVRIHPGKAPGSRTKTVLSLFDEEEDKTEDQSSFQALRKEVGKVSQSCEGSGLQKDKSVSSHCQFCDVSCWIMEGSGFFTFWPHCC